MKDVIALYYAWKKIVGKHKETDQPERWQSGLETSTDEPDAEPDREDKSLQKLRAKQSSVRALLIAIGKYYRPNSEEVRTKKVRLMINEFGLRALPTLELSTVLFSPLRSSSPIDTWTPFEIRAFELAIECYGKEFDQIARMIQTKSCREIVSFYYMWKRLPVYSQVKGRWEKKGVFSKKRQHSM